MKDKMVDEKENEVLVRVKSASHPSCEDVEFTCDPKGTSVRQVKEKIRTLYSFHPDIADQRLIYAGHLLDDVQLLTDVFGLSGSSGSPTSQSSYQHSGPYTIHLACTSKSYISPNQRSTRNENNSAHSQSHQVPFNTQIPNPMMQDPRLANMHGQSNPFEVNGNGNNGIPPEFYALHQLYVEQMSAYMRSWNLAYGIRDMNSQAAGIPVPPGNFPNANVHIPGIIPQPQPAPNVPPQNERPRPGFGGFGGFMGAAVPGNDDEENQRDLLDWAYTLSRVILILSVVYFYSNFTRFLLVVIFTIAIAIVQRRPGMFFNREVPAARAAAAPNGQANVQGNNNNNNPANPPDEHIRNEPRPNENNQGDAEPGNNNGATDAGANPDSAENAANQAAEANIAAGAGQHRLAYYRDVTWTFLTTFFTSLIPEMPQHN